MKAKPSLFLAIAAMAALFSLASCMSPPPVATDGLSAPEIIQRAQESFDAGFFDNALAYYGSILDRFGDNMQLRCQAEYEIGFILYKTGRFEEAKAKLTALLARYGDGPDARLLPSQFRILAEKVLAKIEDRLKK